MASSRSSGGRALEGIRVLDFTSQMSGPVATRLLADLGAEVVKIEPMIGDQVRARPPLRDGKSAYFANLNAGKKSIACNLKSEAVGTMMRELAGRFDIVVENFRPGVMARLGLDYTALSRENDRLIYCSLSGFGQHGPKAGFPAYAPVIHAVSGLELANLYYQDDLDRPAASGIFTADVLTGVHAFGAIQTALFQRERTGKGQYIDVSMLEATLGLMPFETVEAQFPRAIRRPIYTPVRASDGFIMVAPTSERNFQSLCDATGHPEWKTDLRFAAIADRNANWAELFTLIETWTQSRTAETVERTLSEYGVPCGRYRGMQEVLADPQLAQREAFAEVNDGAGTYVIPNPPYVMSGSATASSGVVAALGEHGASVFRTELGIEAAEIARLRASGDLT